MLHVSTSATLQSHIFSFLRVFIHSVSWDKYSNDDVMVLFSFFIFHFQFKESLFKGSAEYCGILCFEVHMLLTATRCKILYFNHKF